MTNPQSLTPEDQKAMEQARMKVQVEASSFFAGFRAALAHPDSQPGLQTSESRRLSLTLKDAKARIAALEADLKAARESVAKYHEYFEAIRNGEYEANRRPAPLRDFEEVLQLKAREALKSQAPEPVVASTKADSSTYQAPLSRDGKGEAKYNLWNMPYDVWQERLEALKVSPELMEKIEKMDYKPERAKSDQTESDEAAEAYAKAEAMKLIKNFPSIEDFLNWVFGSKQGAGWTVAKSEPCTFCEAPTESHRVFYCEKCNVSYTEPLPMRAKSEPKVREFPLERFYLWSEVNPYATYAVCAQWGWNDAWRLATEGEA